MILVPTLRRLVRPTPAWLVCVSLLVTTILFLSERWRWFAFNEHKGWTVLLAVAGVGVVLLLMLAWLLVAPIFRRRFQFGIRALLVLTVAVALPFRWLRVEMKKARAQKEAVAAIETLQPPVEYDLQVSANGNSLQAPLIRVPTWLSSLLGDDFFADVVNVSLTDSDVADAELECPKGLTRLRKLYLSSLRVTDAGLENLKNLPRLESLVLDCPCITDAGLAYLAEQTSVQELYLFEAHVTTAGLEHVRRLNRFRVFELVDHYFGIRDPILSKINPRKIIKALEAFDMPASDKSVKKPKQQLPKSKDAP